MEILKKDLKKLDNSHVISWSYSHLEDKEKLSNCFDAIVTYNVKDNWLLIHLLRYGLTSNPNTDNILVEEPWFIRDFDLDNLKYNFNLYDNIHKAVYDNLIKDLKRKSFTLCDFSDSANCLKKEIDKKNESKTAYSKVK